MRLGFFIRDVGFSSASKSSKLKKDAAPTAMMIL
jgi:hypothetical protein